MNKKRFTFFGILLIVAIFTPFTVVAQTYYLNESLTTQSSFNKFTAVNIKGTQVWYFNSQYPQNGAIMNGYQYGSSHENEDWFISPAINLQNVANPKLTFEHTRGNAGVLNVGVVEGWYKVFATANYTGDISTTQWIEITGINLTIPSAWTFVSSGELAIPEAAKSANTRIAFKYLCNDYQSATWEVKNVSVSGNPIQEVDFKISTWNVDWLSCTDPNLNQKDRELQINNVVSLIQTMNSDIVALQEVGTSNSYKTIDILVERLGSEWAGNMAAWDNNNCSQNQGIIYKKSKIEFVNSSLINNNSINNGGTSYSWSNGRYPVLYNVNAIVGNQKASISFFNIHAKANCNSDSYERRRDASIGLKNLLDGSTYNSKRVAIIGDYNDYLLGTQCESYSISPYKNFIDDYANYKGVTSNLTHPYYGNYVIDNIIISNELFDNYVNNSAFCEYSATQTIPNYRATTSTHYPVSVTFRIKEGDVSIVEQQSKPYLQIYPNPTHDKFIVELEETAYIKLYDILGKEVFTQTSNDKSEIDISHLPKGIYCVYVTSERKVIGYSKIVK